MEELYTCTVCKLIFFCTANLAAHRALVHGRVSQEAAMDVYTAVIVANHMERVARERSAAGTSGP